MKDLTISICILSWNSTKTLENTLKSYKKNGLLEISDDVTVLFQEINDLDARLAKKYGVKHIGCQENIGIGKGIISLFENAKYENVLFLENDWELIENKNTVHNEFSEALNLLNEGYHVIRFRSRRKPGHPLYSLAHKGKELKYFDDWHQVTSPHLLESLHWLDPAKEFPDKIKKQGSFFVTTSRWANWTNNPFLLKKSFYLTTLTPFAGEGVHFEKNIAPWWVKQNFKIAQGEGLFMHNDLKKYPRPNLFIKSKNWIKSLVR